MPEFSAKITKKTFLTENVLFLELKKPKDFEYKAGQFIQFLIKNSEGKIIKRSYSLVSSPENEQLYFLIKILDGEGTKYIKNLKENDEIIFQGPFGKFICETNDKPLFFIATGVGVAPIIGIIEDQLKNKKNQNKIHLLFGVRNEKDIFWRDNLLKLHNDYPNFTFNFTLTQPNEDWTDLQGRVTNHITSPQGDGHYFICGNIEMVKDVRKILEDKSIPTEQIHFEIF